VYNSRVLLSYDEIKRLGPEGVNRLIDYIKTCPGSRVKNLSREDYLVLSNYQKSLFLHMGGTVKRPEMSREDFDKLEAREKTQFIRKGGIVK
jgi:hypothetical protein